VIKKIIQLFLAWLLVFLLFSNLSGQDQVINGFIAHLEKSLQSRDFDSYLASFTPALQERERAALRSYFDVLRMETFHLHWANKGSFTPDNPCLFLQVISENDYSALIEIWQLELAAREGGYVVVEKDVRTNLSQLYKIKIPSQVMERVDSVEIRHVDISMIFKDALLFYDNIPDLETALLVIGKGQLLFSPSDDNEKHQLNLMFQSQMLEDRLDYVFLRFSPTFFENNIKIRRKNSPREKAVSEADKNKAYSLFMKHHRRYFTVQSPLTSDALSFVPRGEEAIFQFRLHRFGELVYIYSPFAEEEVTLYDRSRDRFLNLYSPSVEKGKKRMVVTFGEKYDVRHYDIELSFEPKNSFLSARAKIHLAARLSALDAVKFRFNPALEILRIYDEEKRELFFTQDEDSRNLYVYFLEPVDKEIVTAIEVYYRGILEPPPQLSDTLSFPQHTESFVIVPPRFDTYLYSQSAYWYPNPADEDYFTARLKIIIPPGYSAVANGTQREAGQLNGVQRVTEIDKIGSSFQVFQTETSVKYLAFLVGKFSLAEQSKGSFPIFSLVSSDVRTPRKNILDEVGRILDFYERSFGPFPFETLRIVRRLWMTGGGHSPASFVILNDLPRSSDRDKGVNLVLTGKSPVDLSGWKEYFLAHEIAHQWWGQAVTWARYRDQWLSEGMAQFASILYIRWKYGEEDFSRILKKFADWTEKKSRFGPITLGSRLSYLDFEAYQTIIYNKSALVLNMLHDLMGPDLFFAGLKEFFNERRFSAATTHHFKQAMERASGRNLDSFFALWFDSHLLPEIRARYSILQREGRSYLKIIIDQAGETFVFPLWVEWQEGKSQDRRREKLIIDRAHQEFDFPLRAVPLKIRINPAKAVPGRMTLTKG